MNSLLILLKKDCYIQWKECVLTKVELDAKESGWKLLPESQEISNLAADTKAMKFYMGKSSNSLALVTPNEEDTSLGSYTWENGSFTIPTESVKNVSFKVERGASPEILWSVTVGGTNSTAEISKSTYSSQYILVSS